MADVGVNKSSLNIVEEFYGEFISEELAAKAALTPRYQLVELAHRLLKLKESLDLLWRERGERARSGVLDSRMPLTLHDRQFFEAGRGSIPWRSTPVETRCLLAQHPALKHLLLFSEHVVLHDAIAEWAVYEGQGSMRPNGRRLARAIEELIPVASLVRSGAITLIDRTFTEIITERSPGPGGDWAEFGTTIEHLLSSLNGGFTSNRLNIVYEDPYLAWVAIYKSGLLKEWEVAQQFIQSLDDLREAAWCLVDSIGDSPSSQNALERILRAAYPAAKGPEDVYCAAALAALHASLDIDPVSESQCSRDHLLRTTSLTLDGPDPRARDDFGKLDQFVKYQVPDLSQISLKNVIQIRNSEDVYYELRTSLTELSKAVCQNNKQQDYASFTADVELKADSVLRPAAERLDSAANRGRLRKWIGGYGTAGAVSLVVNGIAVSLGGIHAVLARAIGNTVANTAKSVVSGRLETIENSNRLASNILWSMFPPDHHN